MDPQTQHGLITIVVALGLALVRRPRGRRLLTVLKGAILGALVGAVVFGAPQTLRMLTASQAADELQWWLLKVAATCGVFYGLTAGATLVGLIFAVSELCMWRRHVRASVRSETVDEPLPPAPVGGDRQ